MLTLGGLGIWALIDTVRLAFGKLKDKEGQPLRGYEKNKKWVRILAILHIVIVALIILGIIFSLIITTGKGVQMKARDLERKTDIDAISQSLAAYQVKNSRYPTLSDMNSDAFRQANLANLDTQALSDPSNRSSKTLTEGPSINSFSYEVSPAGCDNATNGNCTSYVLTAVLESGGFYTKQSQ